MKTLLLALPLLASVVSAQTYDVLIRGGRVLDGTGTPWRKADVAINGDRIVEVGAVPATATARRLIDAQGLYVSPGFIDSHSHAGEALIIKDRAGVRPIVTQGVTTVFINPDGGGPLDLPAQMSDLVSAGPGVNVAPLIGHNTVRIEVLAFENRAPSDAELQTMQAHVRAGMEAGAYGLSSGPFYTPGNFSRTDEIVALARVVASFGGVHTSHIRDESDYNIGVVASVEEVIQVSREAKLPGIVTHIKALGPNVWGESATIIDRINAARAEGLEIWADQYPYEASSTGLAAALLPPWAQEGGRPALLKRFENPETLADIRREMVENLKRRAGADNIQLGNFPPDPSVTGKRLGALARERLVDPVDLAIDFLRRGSPGIVSYNMNENDIKAFMAQPWTMGSSDGAVAVFGEGVPHPRAYGPFARRIQKYVVAEKTLSLEQAIHGATALPAAVFGLPDRGTLRPGAIADVIVFDLAKVRETGTYEKPHGYAEGMVEVLVNGQSVIREGEFLDARPGRVLRKNQP
jgi:N-acyl-D-aspartate/D-glutamate deacylase